MNTRKYNWILYIITSTIVITIAVQLYWNFRNYQENKLRVQNEIQSSLDNAIDEYYSGLSKENFFAIYYLLYLSTLSQEFNCCCKVWRQMSTRQKLYAFLAVSQTRIIVDFSVKKCIAFIRLFFITH